MTSKIKLFSHIFFCSCLVILTGCAASRPVEPGAPEARQLAGYPVLIVRAEDRYDRVVAAWRRIANVQSGNQAGDPDLHPVTATLRALPANAPTTLKLPRVGLPDSQSMTENETRESLRRFLANVNELLGANIIQLSLLEVAERGNNLKTARYEQRPFRYPLRNNYGIVEISFTPDGRITQFSSSGIPVDEPMRRTVNQLAPKIAAAEVGKRLLSSEGGVQPPLAITTAEEAQPQELVIFPILARDEPFTLELHLAWEVRLQRSGSAVQIVYLDALTGEILDTANS
ncbi:MAG: PepSY domain-containing protein [Pyrinomonadaceae bacterium]